MSSLHLEPSAAMIFTAGVTIAVLFGLAFALAAGLRRRVGIDGAVVGAPLLFVVGWAVVIEGLSILNRITGTSLTLALVVMLVMALALLRAWRPGARMLADDARRAWRAAVAALDACAWWRWPLRLGAGLAIFTVLVSLVVALINPPNNPDSLAYHLPRVMWWLQLEHVGSYIASDPRELAFPPLNSYLLLVVMGISGSDLAVNLIQWACALLSAVAVLLIGRRAGLTPLALVIAGMLAVTIPTGITVSTTTKADWLAALWPVLAVAIVMSRSRGRLSMPWTVALLAFAGALAAATKPTSLATVALVVVWAIWWELHPPAGHPGSTVGFGTRAGTGAIMALSAAVGAIAGFIPQAVRTAQVYGTATGPDLDIVVTHPSVGIAWGNTMRTLLNNIGVPAPLSDWINPLLLEFLPLIGVPSRDHAALHYDAALQLIIGRNEDFATNPIHLLLGLLACIVVFVSRRAPSRLRALAAVVAVSFVLLVSTLQWNLWTSRFLLSVLVLSALPLGWLLARMLGGGSSQITIGSVLAVVVVGCAALYGAAILVLQEYRPLIGHGSILTTSRLDQYFAVNDRPGTSGDMKARVTRQIERLQTLPAGSRIGLLRVGAQEYLVWRLLNPDGRYTFVNLEGPDGPAGIDPNSLDGLVCIDDCPSGTG